MTGRKFISLCIFFVHLIAELFPRCLVLKNLENRCARLRKTLDKRGGRDLEIEKKITAVVEGKQT